MEIRTADVSRDQQPCRIDHPTCHMPPRELACHIARCFKASRTSVLSSGRSNARDTLARHVAMYVAHVVLSWPYADVARAFSCHRTSVRYACARIEAMRDDPRFDGRICRIESWIAGGHD